MKCAGCGFEALADFAFCPKCGSKLPTACPSCGSVCPPDFSFCPRCGARLAAVSVEQPATALAEAGPTSEQEAVPPDLAERVRAADGSAEADRRLASVLFADLSGFTALSEGLDPEVVRAFQSDLFREMASAIESFRRRRREAGSISVTRRKCS